MSVWPGVMDCAGYGVAFLIVAIAPGAKHLRAWALCNVFAAVVGGALCIPVTLALAS